MLVVNVTLLLLTFILTVPQLHHTIVLFNKGIIAKFSQLRIIFSKNYSKSFLRT